jgi:hypothetical protein
MREWMSEIGALLPVASNKRQHTVRESRRKDAEENEKEFQERKQKEIKRSLTGQRSGITRDCRGTRREPQTQTRTYLD